MLTWLTATCGCAEQAECEPCMTLVPLYLSPYLAVASGTQFSLPLCPPLCLPPALSSLVAYAWLSVCGSSLFPNASEQGVPVAWHRPSAPLPSPVPPRTPRGCERPSSPLPDAPTPLNVHSNPAAVAALQRFCQELHRAHPVSASHSRSRASRTFVPGQYGGTTVTEMSESNSVPNADSALTKPAGSIEGDRRVFSGV